MGQCKICGKEIEDGLEYCDECQKELNQMDADAESFDELDLDLDDFDFQELSGDLLETDLDFELENPDNNLENPQIVVREKEEVSQQPDMIEASQEQELPLTEELPTIEELPLDEESVQVDLPEQEEQVELDMNLDSLLPDSDGENVELPDLDKEVENAEEGITDAALEELLDGALGEDSLDLSGLLPEDVVEDEIVSENSTSEHVAMDDGMNVLFDESGMDSGLSDIMNIGLSGDGAGLFDLGMEASEEPTEADIAMMDALPDAEEIVEEVASKKKISIWKRLFGNIKDEKWEKQKAEEEKKEAARLAKKEAKKAAESEAQSSEEGEGGEKGEAKLDPKEAKKAAKLAKKEEKARKKAEKKEERQRQKELAELEEEDDEGRINRVGAAVIFVLVGLFGAGVIVGTNVFSYRTSLSRAEDYFNEDEYAAAYMELHGLDLKEKDKKLYDQVRTVMFVDKELSSFENYTGIRMYPEALHSLLKGLEKYDSHVEEAVTLDVTEDYDKLRNRILKELSEEYELTEEEAYRLIDMEDQAAYSKEVIAMANE